MGKINPLEVTIPQVHINTSGTTDTIQFIQTVYLMLKNFDEPMEKTKKLMKERIEENWKLEGGILGNRWKNLAPSTIAYKKWLVKEGKGNINPENVEKILMRSGRMRHSFRYEVKRRGITKKPSHTGTGRTELKIYNIAPYFAKHQSANPADRIIITKGMFKSGKPKKGRSKTIVLPRRVMLGMSVNIEITIERFVEDWLDAIAEKSEREEEDDSRWEWTTF